MVKETIKGKRRARKLVLQALYQWLMAQTDLCELEAQFCSGDTLEKIDTDYFHRLLYGVVEQLPAIEAAFSPFLDRAIHELNPIELSVLRLSTFELLYCPELPYRVVLDEAVSLAKSFGSQDGYRYVNGVLNNLTKIVRAIEVKLDHG